MITRTKRVTLTFKHSFSLKGVDRLLAPGQYEVVSDEELIEELSFPVYRRVATMMYVPAQSLPSSYEMVIIDPLNLKAARDKDTEASTQILKKPC